MYRYDNVSRIALALLFAVVIDFVAVASEGNPILGKWLVTEDQSGTVPSSVGDVYVFTPKTSTVVGRGSSAVKYQIAGNAVTVRWPSGEWMRYAINGNVMKSDDGVTLQKQN